MKIFVQIASYRDPQLVPTIKDMIDKAKKPKNLVLGIARQFSETDGFDNLDEFRKDKRFKILDIPYQEAQGVCWARNLVQQLYNGEEYTLQIDSHMRFEKNWDETLINMIKGLQKDGYKKPLLTGYVPSFDPENDPEGRAKEPWRMAFDRFIPEGAVFFLPESIPGWKEMTKPVTARFYSAHFCFTLGQFSKEVQHNPNYYFHGEEISIAARAYTWGYDLFHPHVPVVYHEYTRKGRTKQWDDDKKWGERNRISHLINRKLFGMDGEIQEGHDGPFGFGTERSLRDYEKYAGMLFEKRAVQKYTLDKNYPPNPYNYESEEEWKKDFAKVFKHCIDIAYNQVPEKDYDFWVVAFHGSNDETLFRKDSDKNEIDSYFRDPDKYCKVWREFQTDMEPAYWVVWPHSVSKGWCDRITGQLTHNHVS
jgi:glycosyltransferase involved in cell wall biosynthesis